MWLPWKRKPKRGIFEYRDGTGAIRSIDPLVAWRALREDEELDPTIHFDMMAVESTAPEDVAMADDAQATVVAATRRAFGLTAYSPDNHAGLTEQETLGVLWSFLAWIEAQKKSIGLSPTLPQPTAPASLAGASPTIASS